LFEKNVFIPDSKLFNSPPSDIQLVEIYRGLGGSGALIAYKVNINGE
jgi:hypothetical protein